MNKKITRSIISLFFLCCVCSFTSAQNNLIQVLDEEIQREMKILQTQEIPAYYLSYRVDEIRTFSISTSFGSLTDTSVSNLRLLTITLRVGSPQLDNYHNNVPQFSMVEIPSPEEPLAVKQVIWNATRSMYEQAVNNYSIIKANISLKVEEEDKSPDFSSEKPFQYMEPSHPVTLDKNQWISRLKIYSGVFLKDPDIFSGSGYLSFQATGKYFVSSEGTKIYQENTSVNVGFSGIIKAQDGMEMPLIQTYFAFQPETLPSHETILADVNRMVINLTALKKAPVADPYTGPALLSGNAAGVFFHEIFGHRIEGQRMKSETDGQTFKKKINQTVLPDFFNVYCHPQQKTFKGQDLNGYYEYDDEGIKGQRVELVEKGILKNFLMSRTPIKGFMQSNGHGRAMPGVQAVSRQSNLIIENLQPKSREELRKELIRLAKEQNQTYGYFFDEVVGGFTNTGRYSPNAFNVTPTLVYRIYTDGRPDELVRGVNLIGTPLAMFSQIASAGDTSEVFNGMCGAESGNVPVSAISPMLLVKQIETQKKMKSQDKPMILPRPDNDIHITMNTK